MLECVINLSEGRDTRLLAETAGIVKATGDSFLDLHTDPDHHRSVVTVIGHHAPRALTRWALETLDISYHDGVHPRLGTVDVVPFVPLWGSDMSAAIAARDDFAAWAADELGVPCFLYGPERSLPEVRKRAFVDLAPDAGPHVPHRRAGAICVGARDVLVAWNLWIDGLDVAQTRTIAARVRTPAIRTLGLRTGHFTQVSVNLVDPHRVGPDVAYDAIVSQLPTTARVVRSELVGLLPRQVLEAIDLDRWEELDLDDSRTIEARLDRQGL